LCTTSHLLMRCVDSVCQHNEDEREGYIGADR
jgi:hypothetical protein